MCFCVCACYFVLSRSTDLLVNSWLLLFFLHVFVCTHVYVFDDVEHANG